MKCFREFMERLLEGWTLVRAAKALGVPLPTLHYWRTGTLPDAGRLEQLAERTGVEVSWLRALVETEQAARAELRRQRPDFAVEAAVGVLERAVRRALRALRRSGSERQRLSLAIAQGLGREAGEIRLVAHDLLAWADQYAAEAAAADAAGPGRQGQGGPAASAVHATNPTTGVPA